ncbi:MAG: biopolymer transporter ExbD [Planctomycetes bacterium]|nr:biopolymer transporter ExbD [Planctomycetota bacterium]
MSKLVQQNVEMDMTPMIDCVFLLMIFFVLVIDLSQKNLEDLILPRAVFQEADDKPAENRPIINVLQDGTVVYNKEVFYDPKKHGKNYAPIKQLLLDIRKLGLFNKTLHLKDEKVGSKMVPLVDEPILIRADKWTEWHYIGEIMKQCSQPEIAFWKVELALSEQDKETGEKNPDKGGQK